MIKKAIVAAALGLAVQPLLAQDAAMVAETRQTALQLVTKLGAALKEEIQKGPDEAVGVCTNIAPREAGALSRRTGWRVTRVSLKVRNPLLGTPDAWEIEALKDFDKRAAAGENAGKLEMSAIVDEGGTQYLRYIKALPVQPMCLSCHGTDATITSSVKAKLAVEYPHDKAVGYTAGQVRGGLSVKRPL
jgi:hypothetical protein